MARLLVIVCLSCSGLVRLVNKLARLFLDDLAHRISVLFGRPPGGFAAFGNGFNVSATDRHRMKAVPLMPVCD
jgi:hypothetical protein